MHNLSPLPIITLYQRSTLLVVLIGIELPASTTDLSAPNLPAEIWSGGSSTQLSQQSIVHSNGSNSPTKPSWPNPALKKGGIIVSHQIQPDLPDDKHHRLPLLHATAC